MDLSEISKAMDNSAIVKFPSCLMRFKISKVVFPDVFPDTFKVFPDVFPDVLLDFQFIFSKDWSSLPSLILTHRWPQCKKSENMHFQDRLKLLIL